MGWFSLISNVKINKKRFVNDLLTIHFEGFALALFPLDNPIDHDGFHFVVSLMGLILNVSCLSFQYYLRSNLRVYISNSSSTKTMADFQVDGGFNFHQVLLDFLPGKYQIIWEIRWDQAPAEVVRNYRAAIDDVRIISGRCAELREFVAEKSL